MRSITKTILTGTMLSALQVSAVGDKPHLTVATVEVNGLSIVRKWPRAIQRKLTYCVSNEFGDRKAEVVAAVDQAAGNWEAAADIDFVYAAAEDAACNETNEGVLFDVYPVHDQDFLAMAFFPLEPRSGRRVAIDASAFESSWSLSAIVTHELGHVLGFRHEHARPEALHSEGCDEAADGLLPVTDYDDQSIMGYPQCRWRVSWVLSMSELDRAGAARVYGRPTRAEPLSPESADTEIAAQ